jgi:hypothetical protein
LSDIAKAEAIVFELQRERRVAIQHARDLADERMSVTAAAQRYEVGARSRLHEINAALQIIDAEIRAVDCSLGEAGRALAVAQHTEAA